MKQITKENILDFETKLIEIGDVYKVQPDHTIINKATNEHVTIPDGKTRKPIAFFVSGMPVNSDIITLNPFKEIIGGVPVRDWFYGTMNTLLSCTIKALMTKTIKDSIELKDDNLNQFPLLSKLIGKTDTTMIDEINKVSALNILTICYHKSKKTAEAQCNIFDDEAMAEAYPKFRKKTWEVFRTLLTEFFGTDEISESYTYTSQSLAIPETDAKLHIIVSIIRSIAPWCRDLLEMDLHASDLEEHLDVVEGYAKMYAWQSPVVTQPERSNNSMPNNAPWNTGMPAPINSIPANLVPTAALPVAPVSYAPTFNPLAGPGMMGGGYNPTGGFVF